MQKILPLFLVLWIGVGFCKDFRLYYLGGQSNMDGYGHISDLPSDLLVPFSTVYIFHGNSSPDNVEVDGKGIWEQLKAGHGVGFSSDGFKNTLSKRFGVELTFAQALLKEYPGENIAIIKYSRGGSAIDQEAAGKFGCWEPDFYIGNHINQYDHFLATLRNAFVVEDIDQDGETDRLIPAAIIWMQGESDAVFTGEIADNTAGFIEQMHTAPQEQQEAMFNAVIDDPRFDIDEDDRGLFMDVNARKAIIGKVKGKIVFDFFHVDS